MRGQLSPLKGACCPAACAEPSPTRPLPAPQGWHPGAFTLALVPRRWHPGDAGRAAAWGRFGPREAPARAHHGHVMSSEGSAGPRFRTWLPRDACLGRPGPSEDLRALPGLSHQRCDGQRHWIGPCPPSLSSDAIAVNPEGSSSLALGMAARPSEVAREAHLGGWPRGMRPGAWARGMGQGLERGGERAYAVHVEVARPLLFAGGAAGVRAGAGKENAEPAINAGKGNKARGSWI
jgi:hypothetical protein